MANAPVKKLKIPPFEIAVWENERETSDGSLVNFKTVSLRKSWKDDKDVWRDAVIQLRRQDIPKIIVLLNKIQEELFLTNETEAED